MVNVLPVPALASSTVTPPRECRADVELPGVHRLGVAASTPVRRAATPPTTRRYRAQVVEQGHDPNPRCS